MQIHTEIDKDPLDAFSFVFFLFQNEHVVVKELLKFLVCEVNTQLFETIELLAVYEQVVEKTTEDFVLDKKYIN